jgi:hypothetical protein
MSRAELVGVLGEAEGLRLETQGRVQGRGSPIRARWLQGSFEGFGLEIVAGSTLLA